MKFLVYVAMVAISGVSAGSTAAAPTAPPPTDGDKDCLANYIVRQCLLSQNEKLAACSATDHECQCYASQAIATCYNNCPNDARAPGATQAMNGACMAASAYATITTKATSTAEAAATTAAADDDASASSPSVVPTRSVTSSAPGASKTNGAESLAGNAAGMLAAVAGAVAIVL
ncbi:GPI anchored serine-threonine rich protein [Metarhizium guizhouense ARSEF 977]|uniref:GPI anchored serine-threonine rich protein n=1 Tax=Metarhizium guizhouense (strain ARSEF 977) TaxID=1276136 RepID=A0A0B4GJC4_METGA|nr:GPI anchored serine-threonine rich protein [Metarhizium guizhouense ARSEF 977]